MAGREGWREGGREGGREGETERDMNSQLYSTIYIYLCVLNSHTDESDATLLFSHGLLYVNVCSVVL